MIISRISGGLGNQMFQYAIARSMAVKNNDVFKLDISFYPKQTLRKYELNCFKINEKIAIEKECVLLRGKEGLLFKIVKKLNLPLNHPISYIKEKENATFCEEVFNTKGNIYLDGFWQNAQYFQGIREELIKDFTPTTDVSIEASNYLNDIKKSTSISLHVRRGDYIANSNAHSVHGVCDLEYYKKAINYIVNTVTNPIFYIFSDDITWCKKKFDFVDNKIFVDTTKNAIDDLELMKNCKHNIIANSTFSWWGAWLNENSYKIVIAPSVWWIAKGDKNIALSDWIKI